MQLQYKSGSSLLICGASGAYVPNCIHPHPSHAAELSNNKTAILFMTLLEKLYFLSVI
jgi:hypothetical protein